MKTIRQVNHERNCENGQVIVVEDDPAIRSGLEQLFESESYSVTAFASVNAFLVDQTLIAAAQQFPTVLICDVMFPEGSSLDTLSGRHLDFPVVFMSGASSEREVVEAYKQGAFGFLLKPMEIDELLAEAARALAAHHRHLEQRTLRQVALEKLARLTLREREVVDLICLGLSNSQIGDHLNIALRTVKLHKQHAIEKLDKPNLPDLIKLLALSQQLTELPNATAISVFASSI
ncbi:response regulator transcription factor [Aequoribacter sp.]|uniref:response regulator transcription factor n=1 Tax=Aequoribacter sp. TaxID=2847771 RepID=UPI003F6A0E30